jgi:hypothetical protein
MEVPPDPPDFGTAFPASGDYNERRSGNFFVNFFSDQGNPLFPPLWNHVLSFSNTPPNGEYICTNPPYVPGTTCRKSSIFESTNITFVASELNLSGGFVNGGFGTLPTQVDGVPIIYSVDGAQECVSPFPQQFLCSGLVNLNAFRGFATPPGGLPNDPNNSVPVDVDAAFVPPGGVEDPIQVTGTVTYDEVLDPGYTTLVTSSQAGGEIDANFRVDVPGWVQIFLDISTTATLPEPTAITVCADYLDAEPPPDGDGIVDGTLAEECDLRFLHNEGDPPDPPGVFVDRTLPAHDVFCPFDQEETPCLNPDTPEEDDFLCINTVTNQICAGVTSLFSGIILPRNNPPVIETLDVTAPAALGEPVTATVNFCDPDFWQTHTITIDWGDGTSTTIELPAGTSEEDECQDVSETREAAPEDNYVATGVYTVTVTVEDEAGASDSASEFAVIYDPSSGFVTGGGWIDSPTSAYAADPNLTGKANFGFVSKYKKGADVPTGNTQFQFKVADLNFKSTSYQWLLIAGSKAKFKGDGTINGDGNYGFMLTGIDGDLNGGDGVDKFRIKIWDSDDNIVYDNKTGEDDDADPTALGGGSIVIHKPK